MGFNIQPSNKITSEHSSKQRKTRNDAILTEIANKYGSETTCRSVEVC